MSAVARPRGVWWRRLAVFVVGVALLDILVGRYVARPLGIIRRSADPEIVYENTPGAFWGRTTYDVWRAPLYMVWDLARVGGARPPERGEVLYRIDDDGCRAPSTGPLTSTADVLVVGSSQGFGMLLPAEQSVPMLLERALRERGYRDARVANCSVVGHRFLQTLQTVRRTRPLKRPRVVVVLVRPWHMTAPFGYIEVMSPRNAALRWAMQRSSLVRLAYYYTWRDSPQPRALAMPEVDARLDVYARELDAAGVRSEFFLLDDGTPDCAVFDGLAASLRARGLGVQRVATPTSPREMFVDSDRHWSLRGGQYTTQQLLDPVSGALDAAGAAHTP